jgi:hypothetical protein
MYFITVIKYSYIARECDSRCAAARERSLEGTLLMMHQEPFCMPYQPFHTIYFNYPAFV